MVVALAPAATPDQMEQIQTRATGRMEVTPTTRTAALEQRTAGLEPQAVRRLPPMAQALPHRVVRCPPIALDYQACKEPRLPGLFCIYDGATPGKAHDLSEGGKQTWLPRSRTILL